MSTFRFTLQSVLRVRESSRDQRRSELAEAWRAMQVLEAQIAGIDAELARLHADNRRFVAQTRPDLDRLIDGQRYELLLRAQRAQCEQHRRTVGEEVERRRQALVAADRDVKALEQLRATQHQRHQAESQRQEMRFLDEVASRRHGEEVG